MIRSLSSFFSSSVCSLLPDFSSIKNSSPSSNIWKPSWPSPPVERVIHQVPFYLFKPISIFEFHFYLFLTFLATIISWVCNFILETYFHLWIPFPSFFNLLGHYHQLSWQLHQGATQAQASLSGEQDFSPDILHTLSLRYFTQSGEQDFSRDILHIIGVRRPSRSDN